MSCWPNCIPTNFCANTATRMQSYEEQISHLPGGVAREMGISPSPGGGGCPGDGNNPISRQGVAREMAISPSPGVGVRVHSTQDHWPACRRSDIPWMLFAATCQISFVLTCENCLIRCGKFMPPCRKCMIRHTRSRQLVKKYGSVAGNLCLVAGKLWFDKQSTGALREIYEPRWSFAATCKNLWICCGKFMPGCGKFMIRHTHNRCLAANLWTSNIIRGHL